MLCCILISQPDSSELYYVEQRGERDCSDGSVIRDKTECEAACVAVGAPSPMKLQHGKPCFKNRQGKCRQNNQIGGTASLICKNRGNQIYAYTVFVFSLSIDSIKPIMKMNHC